MYNIRQLIKMEKAEKTAQLVKEEIMSSLFVNESLKKGIVNYSALVRELLPKIKLKNRKANSSSVLIAIQRYYDEIKNKPSEFDVLKKIISGCELIVKNKIVSFTFERNKKIMNMINLVSHKIRWDMGDIMFFVQGAGEVTLIIDKKNSNKFESLKSSIIEKKEELAILSLRESDEFKNYSKEVKGFVAFLTTTLADNNINIIDIASTYKQIIFLLDEKDIMNAYETLNKLICNSK